MLLTKGGGEGGTALHPGQGRPHLRDEDQSQSGADCAVGVEEEEEEGPVRVQRRNQQKPESAVGGGSLAVGSRGLFPSPGPDLHGGAGWGEEGTLFPSCPL